MRERIKTIEEHYKEAEALMDGLLYFIAESGKADNPHVSALRNFYNDIEDAMQFEHLKRVEALAKIRDIFDRTKRLAIEELGIPLTELGEAKLKLWNDKLAADVRREIRDGWNNI